MAALMSAPPMALATRCTLASSPRARTATWHGRVHDTCHARASSTYRIRASDTCRTRAAAHDRTLRAGSGKITNGIKVVEAPSAPFASSAPRSVWMSKLNNMGLLAVGANLSVFCSAASAAQRIDAEPEDVTILVLALLALPLVSYFVQKRSPDDKPPSSGA
uniref:Uncharacterized protein n=1 Tax=Mantoniella antarctica TaxID=81844 RepID=A0A7S0SCC6_9CHLO